MNNSSQLGQPSGKRSSDDIHGYFCPSPRICCAQHIRGGWAKIANMGLREAIKVSNVPVYQELARRIGLERMRDNVARMGFGNGEIGTVVDNFWLDGPLKISAVEQTQFLARLARDELPFPKDAQAKVREIVHLEQGDGWTLYGKTGWVNVPNPGIGWWVGWVIKESHVYSFALNIDITLF